MLAVGFGAQEDLFSITLKLCGSPWLEHSWEHQEQGKDWGVSKHLHRLPSSRQAVLSARGQWLCNCHELCLSQEPSRGRAG